MSNLARMLATLLLVGVVVAASTSAAERVRVHGTGVSLEPPAAFSAADNFPGFQLAERGASIMVTELPGPASEIRKGMTRDLLATRGMTLIESRSVKVRGTDALLLRVSQRAGGIEYLKWMIIMGNSKRTVMVVGMFPSMASDLSEPVKRALLSVSWAGRTEVDRFEGLQFRVESTAELQVAERVGNALVLSESGTIEPGNPDQAILVVGSSLSDADIGSLERFSKERAAKTASIKDLRNVRGRELEIDGLPGYELIAETNDAVTDRAVGLYQLVLADGRGYFLAQGLVTRRRATEFLPAFRRLMSTFRRAGAHADSPKSR